MTDEPTDNHEQDRPALGHLSAVTAVPQLANDRLQSWAEQAQHWLVGRPRIAAIVVLIRDVIVAQGQTRASLASAGAAFWLVIALFPAVTAAVSIFGLVVDPAQVKEAFDDVGSNSAGSLGAAISQQITILTEAPAASLSLGLVISLLFSLWSVSTGTYALMRAIRLSYGLGPQGYIVARFRGLIAGTVAVVMIGLVAFASSTVASVNSQLSGLAQWAFTLLVYFPVTGVVITGSIMMLCRYSIATKTNLRNLLPGSVCATVSLILMVTVVSKIVTSFGGDSAVYGVAAGAVTSLIAVYTGIYVIVLGAIVNAHWPHRLASGRIGVLFQSPVQSTGQVAQGDKLDQEGSTVS